MVRSSVHNMVRCSPFVVNHCCESTIRLKEISQCGYKPSLSEMLWIDKAVKGHLQGVFVDERTVALSLHGNKMINVSA